MDVNDDLRPFADKAEEILGKILEALATERDRLVEGRFCSETMADNIAMNAAIDLLVSSTAITMNAGRLPDDAFARFRMALSRELHEFLGHLLAKYSKEGKIAFIEIPQLPQSELVNLLRHLRSSGGGHRESCAECQKIDEILE